VPATTSTRLIPAAGARAAAGAAALAAVGVTAFVALLVAVQRDTGLASFDPQVTQDVVAMRTPVGDALAQVVTFLGGGLWLTAVTVAAVGILILHGERLRAWIVVVAMIPSAAGTVLIKLLVSRPRPGAPVEIGGPETSFSFPSGHTLNSTVCYGIIAVVSLPLLRSVALRIALGSVAGLVVLAVGSSRVYLAHHWATDVLAGWSLGLGILALAVIVTVLWVRSPRTHHSRSEIRRAPPARPES
jgi:membrane-associated phospholipid phosphatase